MKANGTNNGCNRLNTPLAATTLEDPGTPASWKGPPPGSEASPFTPNSVNQGGGPNSGPYNSTGGPPSNAGGFQGPSPFPGGAGSPAGGPSYQGPPPGSGTPQYTASPAPSGSSTPGPAPPPNAGFPPPNSGGPSYNGPSPFGSPQGGPPGQFMGRPGSSGPPFVPPGGPGGPPPHFTSPGQPFPGQQYGMPPGSPFGPGPHPMAGPHMGPGHPAMMGPGGPVDRIDQGSSMPVPRRPAPCYGQPDYRFYELNKRLQQRTEESDNLWWDSFANEFFEEDATLTLTFCLEDGPKRYTIGRTLIPRYFRSIFEGGVTELYYNMKHPKESFHNTSITLDCDHCVMVTHHGKPTFTKVCTEGRLILEFTFDDLMRIKSWHMAVRQHRELVPKAIVSMTQDPTALEQLTKNITRQGITNSTLNYLRLCVILEPMQELMSRHKAYALSPRDCLKTTLFQKWQRMVAPPESQRPANKRRKRKSSTSGPGNNPPPAPSKKRSPGPNFSLTTQDVMVVGEPSLMGGEFGDEDERLITRLENTQYDASNSLDPHSHEGAGGPPPHPHQFHSEPQPGNSWPPDRGPGPPGPGGPGSQGVQGGQGGAGGGVQGSQDASQQQQDKKSPAVSQ